MSHTSGRFKTKYLIVIPSFVMLLAGLSKWSDPTELALFLRSGLEMHAYFATLMIAYVIGAAEIVIAIAMLWSMTGTSRYPYLVGAGLFLFFTGLLIRVLMIKQVSNIDCGCFGSLQIPFVGRSFTRHFVMNAIMGGICLACFVMPDGAREEKVGSTFGIQSA